MHAPNMLSQILLSGEPSARTAFAVVERAEERFLRPAMHLVHFAFVAQEPAAVGEALEFLAAGDGAFVGAVVLVHVFAVKES
jgi:hypothetical protein